MITLTTPVKELHGVGPRKAQALKRLGIETVDDLLHHYPSGYTFAPPLTEPLQEGKPGTACGTVTEIAYIPRGLNAFKVTLDSGLRVTWFGGQYLRQSIFRDSRLMVSGVVKNGGFTNPEWRILKPDETPDPSLLNTVTYPVTDGITSKDIGRLIRQIRQAGVWPGTDIWWAHCPATQVETDYARRRLKYDELFYMQLALAVRQARREQEPPTVRCAPAMGNIGAYFPFKFTNAQTWAIGDITSDLYGPRAMNRLLQGDVGSGKTAVAAYAAIVMAFNGGQTAILCPTEILARQHYETIRGYFDSAGVSSWLVLNRLSQGKTGETPPGKFPHILVGTTALLSDVIEFDNLGLVVIDELHKFGVEQRAALRRHGNPHVLSMSATPIPRTIAMTVFGDLDVSTIKTLPPGRKPVITKWCSRDGRLTGVAMATVVNELAAGHQVYVVCPRIEALDDEMRAVEEVRVEYGNLFRPYTVGMLHGRMTPPEKQLVAEQWADSHIDILVSTTVVEVGVDNPNATVMVVEGAERFGLAQLHQLRGRVGRGEHQSYCFLLSETDSQEARARLRAMERTNSGFEIAEVDLIQRGPGDLLSTRQHGLPELKIADLVTDYDLLVEARKEAQEMVAKGPLPPAVQAELERRFGSNLQLGDAA